MPNDPSANAPIELPEVLQKELESFFPDAAPPPIDLSKTPEERLRETYVRIREKQPERSALCISGGGIRSATFALGVVQALAKAKLLARFDYLSTVSGGGYLGSMLTAWIHSQPASQPDAQPPDARLLAVEAALGAACADGRPAPEPAPLRHLRQFSNYISPQLGLFSADGWTLVATALRNLLLNWNVLVLILAGLLVLPWLGLLGVLAKPSIGQLHALLAAAFVCIAGATAYPGFDLPSQGCFRWRQKWFVAGWLVPLLAGVLCLCAWWAGRTNYYPSDYSNVAEVAHYDAKENQLEDAALWMAKTDALWSLAQFLVAATLAGILACAAITLMRDWRCDKLAARCTGPRLRKLAGLAAASILVFGLPGTLMLWKMARYFSDPAHHAVAYMTFAPALLMLGFFLLNALFVGVTSRCSDDDDREWFARAAGWLGSFIVGWLVIHGLVFWVPQWIETHFNTPALKTAVAASGGLTGFLAAKIGASSKASAFLQDNPKAKRNLLLSATAVAFFALLACGVSLLLDRRFFGELIVARVQPDATRDAQAAVPGFVQYYLALHPAPFSPAGIAAVPVAEFGAQNLRDTLMKPWNDTLNDRTTFDRFGYLVQYPDVYLTFGKKLGVTLLILFGTGLVMGYFVNVNRFSLHATYRNRLVRAYLGAARAGTGGDGRPLRDPHPFTGFDPRDNIELASLTHPRPLHLVNMTLNLVGGDELAWQERLADSFTASRLHCGNHRLGYRPSGQYSDGLSLGTALAISGAAASPNQGYNSSPLVTFLMTLFNVRLGWWLGNPGLPHSHAWKHPGPGQATLPLFAEALGLTNERRAYVNLSDGGHFENLAIYEMLLRRCRFLVVSDAEQDGAYHFEGLGGIVRKARIDLGIVIEFKNLAAVSKDAPPAERMCFAIGTVRYPEGLDGFILYLKPVLLPDIPTDVRHYADTHGAFPHENTGDQYFSESQFEAYRALGEHEMTAVLALGGRAPATVAELCTRLHAQDERPD